MRLPRKLLARSNEENIVPLINVVFLLLVFFMLAGTLEPADPFDVAPPEALIETTEDEPELTVLIGPKGEIALGTEPVSKETLFERLTAKHASDPGQSITVKADAAVHAGVLLPVLEAIRDGGFDSVLLVTVGKKAG